MKNFEKLQTIFRDTGSESLIINEFPIHLPRSFYHQES